MLKIFHGVVDTFYCLPYRYVFVAPKGCGPTLNRLLTWDGTGSYQSPMARRLPTLWQSIADPKQR